MPMHKFHFLLSYNFHPLLSWFSSMYLDGTTKFNRESFAVLQLSKTDLLPFTFLTCHCLNLLALPIVPFEIFKLLLEFMNIYCVYWLLGCYLHKKITRTFKGLWHNYTTQQLTKKYRHKAKRLYILVPLLC